MDHALRVGSPPPPLNQREWELWRLNAFATILADEVMLAEYDQLCQQIRSTLVERYAFVDPTLPHGSDYSAGSLCTPAAPLV
jgi:hypothetical protein